MSKMEKNGMEKLAKVLDSRMVEHSGGGFSFDFGVIKKDYSLVSNTFPLPIPKKDYSVCRLLANLSTNVSGGTHGGHNSGTGSHSHKVVMWIKGCSKASEIAKIEYGAPIPEEYQSEVLKDYLAEMAADKEVK